MILVNHSGTTTWGANTKLEKTLLQNFEEKNRYIYTITYFVWHGMPSEGFDLNTILAFSTIGNACAKSEHLSCLLAQYAFTLVWLSLDATYSIYVETRPPVIWTGKNEYGRVEIWVDE